MSRSDRGGSPPREPLTRSAGAPLRKGSKFRIPPLRHIKTSKEAPSEIFSPLWGEMSRSDRGGHSEGRSPTTQPHQHHLLQCPHRPLPSPQDSHSLRECNFDAPPANNRLRSRSPIREDHDVRTTPMGRSMRGRGLRRSPTRPRTASGKRGGKLHRMESEGAIGQRDSAHPVSHRAHAPGEWIQAPLSAQSRTPLREHSAQ